MQPAVQNKTSLIELLRAHSSAIRGFGVNSMGLFGSFVRNSVKENSDVDLFVDFDPSKKTYDNFMDLAFYLEEILGRKIDIVTPQSLNKYIAPHILKELEYVGL